MTCCKSAPTSSPIVLSETESVCPVCLRRLPAQRILSGQTVTLHKTCPDHGDFSAVIWRGAPSYEEWGRHPNVAAPPPHCQTSSSERGCPFDCGLCPEHRQHSCCVLLEVTSRCNLRCPVCFASAGQAGNDPNLEEISAWMEMLGQLGHPVNIQLSGGEPTVRDDLPEIIELCRRKGAQFIQVNTNGVRLAHQSDYALQLRQAGLDCVFLQFDGLTPSVHHTIRGTDMSLVKALALAHCAEAGLGVVLVPVLVPGVNTGHIGDIIRFAITQTPTVRAVHFQPISYFGRYPTTGPADTQRFTLPEVLRAIESQTLGAIRVGDFQPGTAENPYCSFNGQFSVRPDGTILSTRHPIQPGCCGSSATMITDHAGDNAARARQFVTRRWAAEAEEPAPSSSCCPDIGTDSLDHFLAERGNSLCISGMVFQDAWTLDLDRLRQCYIHIVSPDRRLVPLCAYNLSTVEGRALYRQGGHR